MVKNQPALGSIPGWGRSPGEKNGSPLYYFCLGNPKDRRAWWLSPWGPKELDTTEQLTHTHTDNISSIKLILYFQYNFQVRNAKEICFPLSS